MPSGNRPSKNGGKELKLNSLNSTGMVNEIGSPL
jgi:hypothetical protein